MSRMSPAIPAVTSSRLIEGSLTEAAARKAAIETSVNIAKGASGVGEVPILAV